MKRPQGWDPGSHPSSGFVLIPPYAHLLSQVWPVSKPGRKTGRLEASMALLGSWGTRGVPGVCIFLSMETLGSTVSVLKDELCDYTRPMGLPRPQSHTSTSGTLTRAGSSFCSNHRAACLSVVKPRVMLRPQLPWDTFCGLYYLRRAAEGSHPPWHTAGPAACSLPVTESSKLSQEQETGPAV